MKGLLSHKLQWPFSEVSLLSSRSGGGGCSKDFQTKPPNATDIPHVSFILSLLLLLEFFFFWQGWWGRFACLLFFLSILLTLLCKDAEASLAKTELSLEGEGGKGSQLARQNCLEWAGSGRREAWKISLVTESCICHRLSESRAVRSASQWGSHSAWHKEVLKNMSEWKWIKETFYLALKEEQYLSGCTGSRKEFH